MAVGTTDETGENRGFNPVGAPPASQRMPDEREARQSVSPPPPDRPSSRRRRLLIGALGVLVLAAALWFGIPWIQMTLNTVSTYDAYVNGHVTFEAKSRASSSTTTTVCARENSWSNWTRSHFRLRSRSKRRLLLRQRQNCKWPSPKCAASKRRP